MSQKKIIVLCVVIAVVIFLITRRNRGDIPTTNPTTSPETPIRPNPVPVQPTPVVPEPVTGKSGLAARYVRVQSTKVPPHIDGAVNLEAILAYSNGIQQKFVDGRVVPTDGAYGWRNLLAVDNSIAHTAVNNEVGVAYVELDLAAGTRIDTVKVVNRADPPWKERTRNATLVVYDEGRREVFRQVFPGDVRDEYVFNLVA